MKQLIALISVVLLSMLNQVSLARKINDHNQEKKTENTRYHFGQSSPDGIGKFYMGREISHVMGHLAAGWLERPEREQEERVSLLVEALNLKAGEISLHNDALLHGSEPNISNNRRCGLTMRFSPVNVKADLSIWPHFEGQLVRGIDNYKLNPIAPIPRGEAVPTSKFQHSSEFSNQ